MITITLREALTVAEINAFFEQSEADDKELFIQPIQSEGALMLGAGAEQLLAELNMGLSWDLANPLAYQYLEQHGAALIAKINNETRQTIKKLLLQASDESWSYQQTARNIIAEYDQMAVGVPGGYTSRAERIAVTEAENAYEEGNWIVAQDLASGGIQLEKKWDTAPELSKTGTCDICQANADEGWIPADQPHASGDEKPLAHVNCLPGSEYVIADGIQAAMQRFYNGEIVVIQTTRGNELACTPNHPILTPGGWVAAGLLNVGSDVISADVSEFSFSPFIPHNQKTPTPIHEVVKAFRRSGHVGFTEVPVSTPDFHGDGRGSQVAIVWAYRHLRNQPNTARGQLLCKFNFTLTGIRDAFLAGNRLLTSFFHRSLTSARRIMGSLSKAPVFFRRSLGMLQTVCIGYTPNGYIGLDETLTDKITTDPVKSAKFYGGFAGKVESDDFFHLQGYPVGVDLGCVAIPSNASLDQAIPDCSLTDTKLSGEIPLIPASKVFTDKVITVERRNFSGHVFNLQTEKGYYIAEGIITHNCHCDEFYRVAGGAG